MKKLTMLLIATGVVFLTSCTTMTPTKDIKISTESDPKVQLNGYKTFAWLASAEVLYDPKGQWEPSNVDIDSELEWLIGRELRSKGLTQVGENPDVMIAYMAGVDMAAKEIVKDSEQQLDVLKNVPKAALVIVMIDPATGNPVWGGVAVGDVSSDRSEASIRNRLDYAVKGMFKQMKY